MKECGLLTSASFTQGKYDLVRSVGEECVTDGELALLMARKPDSFVLYDGFEPSGRMHIAQVSAVAFCMR